MNHTKAFSLTGLWTLLSWLSIATVVMAAKAGKRTAKLEAVSKASKLPINPTKGRSRFAEMARASDPLDYSMEQSITATASEAIYSYDDQAYFTDDENGFEDDLPSCYYPTETNYANLKYCYGHQTRNMPDPCITSDDLVFNNKTGSFSADQTFYNCMANIPDVASMPTFFNGKYHGCMLILTQVTLLNLVQVNEIEGIVELQVIIDYTWQDRRYNMGEFWEHVPTSYSGFDVTSMLTNDSIVMWRPTIVFPDANAVEVMAETLTISHANTNNNISIFMYEVTYDLVLVQPGFNFRNYPNDDQDIIIRFSALNFDAEQLQLFPSNVACSYLPDHTCSFASNAMWIWKNEPSFQSCTAYPDQKASNIYPSFVYYSVKIVRQGDGIIVRLVLPLMILLLLSALTFWVTYENRVDTTITLLLAVSALYIVILQSIPLVGYLTDIDKFVFWMFVMLCIVVAMHQVYATLVEKVHTWPLRKIYMRAIELGGRCFLPPAIVFYFLATIEFGSASLKTTFITVTILASIGLFFGELFGIRSSYYHAMEALIAKANRPELTTKEFSWIEIAFLNHYLFGEWSTSLHRIAHEISVHGHLHFEKPTSVTLHNMTSLSQVMGGVGGHGGGVGGGGVSGRGRGHGDKGMTATANPLHSLQKRGGGYDDRGDVDHDGGGFQLSVSQPYLEMASVTTAVAAPAPKATGAAAAATTAVAAPPSIAPMATFATVGSSSPKSPLSPGLAMRPSHHTAIDSDDEPED